LSLDTITGPGNSQSHIDVDFIKEHARGILQSSTVEYLKNAELKGSLFGDDTAGAVSAADTNFFIDHTEPQAVLDKFVKDGSWVLGELPDGHEFLMIAPVTRSSGRNLA
jgi:hypothetical protein